MGVMSVTASGADEAQAKSVQAASTSRRSNVSLVSLIPTSTSITKDQQKLALCGSRGHDGLSAARQLQRRGSGRTQCRAQIFGGGTALLA